MNDFYEKISRTVNILQSEDSSLKDLAGKSGFNVFRFYNFSDLTKLDLRGENLTGLNFFGADLRDSNLDGIEYDVGAFNGANLSTEYEHLCDDYDFTIEDMSDPIMNHFYLFAEFRPRSLDAAIAATRMGYTEFAANSGITTSTLRKARNGSTVSVDTARSICRRFFEASKSNRTSAATLLEKNSELTLPMSLTGTGGAFSKISYVSLHQPMIKLMDVLPSGGFKTLTKNSFSFFLERRDAIVGGEVGSEINSESVPIRGRSGSEMMRWILDYRQNPVEFQ